jgi:peptidoglycan glycosyltransferase
LKRVAIVVVLMFVALFVSSTVIQYFEANTLAADARNSRTLIASYDQERGPILVGGQPIAQSVPSGDEYKYQRVYSNGPLYSQVTGYFTLGQGSSGLEQALQKDLAGTSDSQFLTRLNRIFTGQNPKGASVETTIDPVIQQAAWDALGDYKGAVVALEPSTGRVLAMVSKPTFDPNTLAVHDTDQVLDSYNALIDDPGNPLFNRSIAGDQYFPGSTFKIITASAAMQNAGVKPTDTQPNLLRFPLPGSTNTVSNAGGGTCGGGDRVSLQTAFVLSCNIPMAEFGVEMGAPALTDMAKAYGYFKDLSIPLDVTPSTVNTNMTDDKLALSAFGQDDDRVTPLQVAMTAAAVANKGVIMKPNLVDAITASDLSVVPFKPEVWAQPITEDTASTISQFMVQAVSSGAATNARIDGVSVAGKTGTAENGEGDPYTLWFTGFAPADNPKVAIAVVVEDGGGQGQSGTGNTIAAPIAKQVLEAVLSK